MSKLPSNSQSDQVFPKWVWIVYLILFGFSIPWYLPESLAMKLVLGLPLWLICSLIAVIFVAFFTQWIIRNYWKDEE